MCCWTSFVVKWAPNTNRSASLEQIRKRWYYNTAYIFPSCPKGCNKRFGKCLFNSRFIIIHIIPKLTHPVKKSSLANLRRKWQPTPVFLPGESQGRGSLVGCCLWGRAESDTTEATQQQQLAWEYFFTMNPVQLVLHLSNSKCLLNHPRTLLLLLSHKNTGVGRHFLLQCMKVKSESEFAQLCPTLSDPMDCSLPGSSVHGIFQARVLEWGAIAFTTWAQSQNCYSYLA